MRILQLVFNLRPGGAEKFTVDFCNELSKINEVYLCQIQKENNDNSFFKHELKDGVNYLNLGCSNGINFKTFFTIFRLIKEIKPDVVHAHLNTRIYLFLPAVIFNHSMKFIHTIHNLAEYDVGFSWQKKLNNIFYRRRLINGVAISKECKESFINFYKHNTLSLIENGASAVEKTLDYQKVAEEITNLKKTKDDLVFIHVARFAEQKNQQLLIKVFNKLMNGKNDIILLIIGLNHDSEEANNLRVGCHSNIHCLGAKTNVSDYLLNSDVFVLSSLWEGLPISLLEAMSCGVIPVCTPAGGIPDVIKDENVGFLSKDFSEEQFYLAVERCIKLIDVFDRAGLIDYFNEHYSMEKCTNNYLKIYES